MKTNNAPMLILMALLIASVSFGQQAYQAQVSKMSVTGSSTLHEWTSDITQVQWAGLLTLHADQQLEVKNVIVTIPVKSIKSTHGKMMDNKTYEAFKHDKNPNIIYKVSDYKLKVSGSETLGEVTGTLTMAGVTKSIPLQVKTKLLPNGSLLLTAARKLNMTEFKMDPPSAMMGTINVGEEVTVNFEITLTPNKI